MLSGAVICEPSGEMCRPGMGLAEGSATGGNMIQYFEPPMTAFQAEVPLGSAWKVEPEREGPIISQRWSGRWGPRVVKRSGEKQRGGVYAGEDVGSLELFLELSPTESFIFSAKRQSNRYNGLSSTLLRIYVSYVAYDQSTASARKLVSWYLWLRCFHDHSLNNGHCRTGSVRMNGFDAQLVLKSSGVRFGIRAI